MKGPYYFLGIGGIGMSALARWFNAQGAEVAGYDRQSTELTRALETEGIEVDHSGETNRLPASLQHRLDSTEGIHWTVVWTPAIPADFPLMKAFRAAGLPMLKRAEMLGALTRDKPLLAVAGTHGKTTTSALLAHLLESGEIPVDAFLGGINLGHDSNLFLADRTGIAPWIVAEADEFDRSFLTLHPTHAVITSTDADHLDIYDTHRSLLDAFRAFAEQVRSGGLLLHADAAASLAAPAGDRKSPAATHYGPVADEADFRRRQWAAGYSAVGGEGGISRFTLHLKGRPPLEIRWKLPGAHNAANATAAACLAVRAGMEPEGLPTGLATFPGVARRFQVRHDGPILAIVDDYAHHPREIEGTITAARQRFPGRKITGVFQPHLYSRTRDFMEEFASALSALDQCILLPIYAAREEPMPGVDAQGIGEKMTACPVECPAESRFLDVLESMDPDVILFLGAGDLNKWIDPALERLRHRALPHSNHPHEAQ